MLLFRDLIKIDFFIPVWNAGQTWKKIVAVWPIFDSVIVPICTGWNTVWTALKLLASVTESKNAASIIDIRKINLKRVQTKNCTCLKIIFRNYKVFFFLLSRMQCYCSSAENTVSGNIEASFPTTNFINLVFSSENEFKHAKKLHKMKLRARTCN